MPKSTPQAEKLFYALTDRGINCRLENSDGKKHVDISIPKSLIDIEVDGEYHWTNPGQIISDYKRSFWSLIRFWRVTIHIPNYVIDKEVDKVVFAIESVAKTRELEIKNKLLKRFHLNKRQEKQAKQFTASNH